ncbi:hypothetical protein QAD02_002637 [Eretmocerus hayati]|uniref:Uncharacterized protein n=1 Tax=Eretmocerus hayati TaxID=131215 RepID=A0ACC2NJJ7_9HYME|nr:hypothetical protein QAD02_002637 [Eretmocerus hayati]
MNRGRLVLPRPCPEGEEYIPLEILREAEEVGIDLSPTKSRDTYSLRYNQFVDWCESRDINNSVAEPVILAYFRNIRNTEDYAVSTLWNIYSKLKACFKAFRRIDISNYIRVGAYFKKLAEGYEPKQSLVLSAPQVNEFLQSAPEPQFLCANAVLALDISGCCRRHKLVDLTINRVVYIQSCYVVTIPKGMTKNKREKVFRVVGPLYEIVKRYLIARAHIQNSRFFLSYRESCGYINQPAGKETIGAVPCDVGTFLNLPNPTSYTSHCVRRSAATIYATTGITDLELEDFGKWKNLSSAQIYTVDTDFSRVKAANRITNAILPFSKAGSYGANIPRINKVKPRIVTVQSLHSSDAQYVKPRLTKKKRNECPCTVTSSVDCNPVTSTVGSILGSNMTTDDQIDMPNVNVVYVPAIDCNAEQEELESTITTAGQVNVSCDNLPKENVMSNNEPAVSGHLVN